MTTSGKVAGLFTSLFFTCCLQAQDPRDTLVMYQKDSAVVPETEKTVLFFQNNERIPARQQSKILLITKAKKTIKLSTYLKATDLWNADHVLADIDNDGKKELLFSNYTGGAHCCDEIYIYKNIAVNKYQYAARMFAGHTVISDSNEFLYGLHENFGYFFTCYACTYIDTSDAAPIDVSQLTLWYSKGKLTVRQGDAELKSIINDNLSKLGELPYQKPDEDLHQDEGIRKEIALNLAAYYFSFAKNMVETQKLFNKYYKHPDAKTIWTAFAKELQHMRSQNDF